jgi:hypothetical protein
VGKRKKLRKTWHKMLVALIRHKYKKANKLRNKIIEMEIERKR